MKKIFTGMMALLLMAGAAQAQDTTRGKHHGKGKHEMMAKELGLTEEQKKKLKSIHEAERAEMKAVNANRKAIHEKYRQQAAAVFTPAQKAQLEKMKAERKEKAKAGKGFHKGDQAGKRFHKGDKAKRIGESLNLTQDQKDRMAKLREENKAQFQAIRDDKSLSEEQKKEKIKALREAQKEKMKGILTQEQIEKMQSARKGGKQRK